MQQPEIIDFSVLPLKQEKIQDWKLPLGALFFGAIGFLESLYMGIWLHLSKEEFNEKWVQSCLVVLFAAGGTGLVVGLLGRTGLKLQRRDLPGLFLIKLSSDLFIYLASLMLVSGLFLPRVGDGGEQYFRFAGLLVYVWMSFKTAVSKSEEGARLFYWLIPSLIFGPFYFLYLKWQWVVNVEKQRGIQAE